MFFILRPGRVQAEAQRKQAEQELKRAQTHKAAMLKALADLQSGPSLGDSACPANPAFPSQCSRRISAEIAFHCNSKQKSQLLLRALTPLCMLE